MSVLKSNCSLYNIRVDSAVGSDASASSNVWAVDVCVVDQTVITLRTEYTACDVIFYPKSFPLMREII